MQLTLGALLERMCEFMSSEEEKASRNAQVMLKKAQEPALGGSVANVPVGMVLPAPAQYGLVKWGDGFGFEFPVRSLKGKGGGGGGFQ